MLLQEFVILVTIIPAQAQLQNTAYVSLCRALPPYINIQIG